jgi:hypothetical protein
MLPESEVAKLAAEVLVGRLDPIVGCRQLVRRQAEVPEPVRASRHFSVLVGIESETDAFPLGEERKRWASEALAQLDEERDDYMRRNRDALQSALQGIIALCGDS